MNVFNQSGISSTRYWVSFLRSPVNYVTFYSFKEHQANLENLKQTWHLCLLSSVDVHIKTVTYFKHTVIQPPSLLRSVLFHSFRSFLRDFSYLAVLFWFFNERKETNVASYEGKGLNRVKVPQQCSPIKPQCPTAAACQMTNSDVTRALWAGGVNGESMGLLAGGVWRSSASSQRPAVGFH